MLVDIETPADRASIRALHSAAFGGSIEADIVDALRDSGLPLISLVARDGDVVTGHILFAPVALTGSSLPNLLGLGPMAVLPEHQRRGVGSTLVREGLARSRQSGCDAVVVLGHPEFYPRFGFIPASRHGLRCEYDVPDDVFMVLETRPGSLHGRQGIIRYADAFRLATTS